MNYIELVKNGTPVVQSRIDGDFEGFDDATLFILYNGQYWLQKNINTGITIHLWRKSPSINMKADFILPKMEKINV